MRVVKVFPPPPAKGEHTEFKKTTEAQSLQRKLHLFMGKKMKINLKMENAFLFMIVHYDELSLNNINSTISR